MGSSGHQDPAVAIHKPTPKKKMSQSSAGSQLAGERFEGKYVPDGEEKLDHLAGKKI